MKTEFELRILDAHSFELVENTSMHDVVNEIVNRHARRVVDTREKVIREGLIALGWKPPGDPLVLDGAKPKGRTPQTFDQWIASLNGADAIPEDSAVFKYADAAKIPREFVELLWRKFESNYSGSRKRYRDWQKVFRLAVEGCWFDLYRINRAGEYYLTTAGQAFQRSIGAQS